MAVGLGRARAEGLTAERPLEEPLLARITRWTLRFRRSVLVAWLVLLIAGGFASTRLGALLSNEFGVPGTDSLARQRSSPAISATAATASTCSSSRPGAQSIRRCVRSCTRR
jgi:hypothetical protein